MTNTLRLKKLKWLCRRGMKELDLLLEQFLLDHEQQLIDGAWPEFEEFLQTEDDRLWDWLQDPGTTDAVRFYALLSDIRHGTAGAH